MDWRVFMAFCGGCVVAFALGWKVGHLAAKAEVLDEMRQAQAVLVGFMRATSELRGGDSE